MLKISILLSLLLILFVVSNAQKPSVGTKLPIVNGLATDLQKPDYPQEAKDFCAAGIVSVKVEIDEKGNAISAEAITGDGLLRESSIQAAKKSKFAVTRFGGIPIKVEGVVVYNFDSLASKCISVGVVNKRALEIPKPYANISPPKKDAIIAVQIIVNMDGKVAAARAVSGHPMLRAVCENAARRAKFLPSFINGPPVKIKALLVYKFKSDGTIDTNVEREDKTIIGTPINLVEPPSPLCNCRGLGGSVLVQAKIDEQGNVIEAKAFSGHPILRFPSEKAALESKFLPTNTKAKILISYNFVSSDGGRTAKIKSIEVKEVKIEEEKDQTIVGKAIFLPKPPFPSFGGKLGNNTNVLVEAKIDENGNVISAKAISGHPVLRTVCEAAARASKFSPTTISGVPVKAKTLITYEYVLTDEVTVNVVVNGVEAEN